MPCTTSQEHRVCRGLALTLKTLGPFYRIVIRDAPGGEPGAVLAVSSGFTVPAMGLMHCDSLEIFTRGCAPARFLLDCLNFPPFPLEFLDRNRQPAAP